MRNRWTGLALALVMMAPVAPVFAQFPGGAQPSSNLPPEPIPFAPSTVEAPSPPPMPMGGYGGPPSPNSLPASEVTNAGSPPPPPPDHNHCYFSAEYLHWWTKQDNFQGALITTTPIPQLDSNFGALGQGATIPIGGGAGIQEGPFDGVRATIGFAPDWFVPIELTGFFLRGAQNTTLTSDGNGNPVLSRPIFATQGALLQEVVFIASFPNLAGGNISYSTQTTMFGAEVNAIVYNWIHEPEMRKLALETTFGGRYLSLNEKATLNNTTSIIANAPGNVLNFDGQQFGAGFITSVSDQFSTQNQFGGAQIGFRAAYPIGPLNLELRTNSALGVNHELVNIIGASSLFGVTNPSFGPMGAVLTVPGGIQAVASNSGQFIRNRVCSVQEATFTVGLPICQAVQVSAGYNFMWISNVVRPGDQISRFVDTRQAPTDANFTPGLVGANPQFPFTSTTFWAQGLTLTLSLTF